MLIRGGYLKVRTQIGGSSRTRMFAYKGERIKISESSAYMLCGWPHSCQELRALESLYFPGLLFHLHSELVY